LIDTMVPVLPVS